MCRENPQTHQLHLPWLVLYSLAAACLCVSPLTTWCVSERAAQTPSPEGWGSEFIQVCLGFEEDVYKHWASGALPTPTSLTWAPGGKGEHAPTRRGLDLHPPPPASSPLTRAAGITVCSALSTSHPAPTPRARGLPEDGHIPPGPQALPRVLREAATHTLSVPQGGSPSSWRPASWASSSALSGRCLRCPGALPRPGSLCGVSDG